MKILRAAVILAAFFCVPTVRADFNDGVRAFDRGDCPTADQEFQSASAQGNGSASHALGYMYLTGKCEPQDLEQALSWYHKGADQGFGQFPPGTGLSR